MSDAELLDWLEANRKGGRWFVHVNQFGIQLISARHAEGREALQKAVCNTESKP